MGLVDKVKMKVAEKVTENLAEKAERGDFGPGVQKAYRATKGWKTVIGAAFFIITAAVDFWGPPWATDYARLSALAFLGLGWLGFVDKARRNEPIFDQWLLDALRQAAAAFAGASAVMLSIAQSGLLALFLPRDPCAADYLTVGATAAGSIALFLNRVLAASALPAKPQSSNPLEDPSHEQSRSR